MSDRIDSQIIEDTPFEYRLPRGGSEIVYRIRTKNYDGREIPGVSFQMLYLNLSDNPSEWAADSTYETRQNRRITLTTGFDINIDRAPLAVGINDGYEVRARTRVSRDRSSYLVNQRGCSRPSEVEAIKDKFNIIINQLPGPAQLRQVQKAQEIINAVSNRNAIQVNRGEDESYFLYYTPVTFPEIELSPAIQARVTTFREKIVHQLSPESFESLTPQQQAELLADFMLESMDIDLEIEKEIPGFNEYKCYSTLDSTASTSIFTTIAGHYGIGSDLTRGIYRSSGQYESALSNKGFREKISKMKLGISQPAISKANGSSNDQVPQVQEQVRPVIELEELSPMQRIQDNIKRLAEEISEQMERYRYGVLPDERVHGLWGQLQTYMDQMQGLKTNQLRQTIEATRIYLNFFFDDIRSENQSPTLVALCNALSATNDEESLDSLRIAVTKLNETNPALTIKFVEKLKQLGLNEVVDNIFRDTRR